MKWYLTKYALTRGIIEIVDGKTRSAGQYLAHGKHGFDRVGVNVFASLEEAKADQRNRARKAIAAAKKKIAKLEKLLEE